MREVYTFKLSFFVWFDCHEIGLSAAQRQCIKVAGFREIS